MTDSTKPATDNLTVLLTSVAIAAVNYRYLQRIRQADLEEHYDENKTATMAELVTARDALDAALDKLREFHV